MSDVSLAELPLVVQCFNHAPPPQKNLSFKILLRNSEKPGLLELGRRRRCFWNILFSGLCNLLREFPLPVICAVVRQPADGKKKKTPPRPPRPLHLPPRPGLVFWSGPERGRGAERRGEECTSGASSPFNLHV